MNKKAFTLIELLVVIAIIALLLGILLPSLSMAKKYARAVVCGANLRRIGMSLDLYAGDNRDYYPRSLPLQDPSKHSDPLEWMKPWPSSLCPMFWQAGYPSLLVPYIADLQISDPFDYMSLPDQISDSYIDLFRCPGNRIKREFAAFGEPEKRKCGFPLDYGLHNLASQNRKTDRKLRSAFLVADQTWGLAYIPGSDTSGLNTESELEGWWNPFVHPKESIGVLMPDQSVERLSKEEFITKFKTANPTFNDSL
jgi:prepilin-type N-terminal cleavage/methylation domain-containing protein